ncbi:MAG: hypothetical protein ACPGC9_01685 [Cytophagales bacterium]
MKAIIQSPKIILDKKPLWIGLSILLHVLILIGGSSINPINKPTSYSVKASKTNTMGTDYMPQVQHITKKNTPLNTETPVVHAHATNPSETSLPSKKVMLGIVLMAIPMILMVYCAWTWHKYKQKNIAYFYEPLAFSNSLQEANEEFFNFGVNLIVKEWYVSKGIDSNSLTKKSSRKKMQQQASKKLYKKEKKKWAKKWAKKWKKYKQEGRWKAGETKIKVFFKMVMGLSFGCYKDRMHTYERYYLDWFVLKAYEKLLSNSQRPV